MAKRRKLPATAHHQVQLQRFANQLVHIDRLGKPHPQRQPALRFAHGYLIAERIVQASQQSLAPAPVLAVDPAQVLLQFAIIDQVRQHLLHDCIALPQGQHRPAFQHGCHFHRCHDIAATERAAQRLGQ
ncbi:hypothetical protein D9M73_254970 [compost metagenome]